MLFATDAGSLTVGEIAKSVYEDCIETAIGHARC